jgi:hypothetical protein
LLAGLLLGGLGGFILGRGSAGGETHAAKIAD